MTGIKFLVQDLDLDEAGMHTELVIEHHDGTTSFILTDDEVKDLYRTAGLALDKIEHRPRY